MKTIILAAALMIAAPALAVSAFASSERPFDGFAQTITSGHVAMANGSEASPTFTMSNATVRNDRIVISTSEGFALQPRG